MNRAAIEEAIRALRARRASDMALIEGLKSLLSEPQAPEPDDEKSSPATAPRRSAAPKRKATAKQAPRRTTKTAAAAGKLAGKEAAIQAMFEGGEKLNVIGARFGASDEAIRLLAKKRGWKRPDVPVRKLPRGVSGRPEE